MPEEAPPPAVTQRNSRTLKALVVTAQRLLSSGEMDTATIEDITREAGVAKRSFHNHFRDREALIEHVSTAVRMELETLIAGINTDVKNPAVNVTRGLLASFRYGLDNPTGAMALVQLTPGAADPAAPRNHQLASTLQIGMDQGVFKLPNLDAGLILVLGLSDLGLSRLLHLHDQRPRARLMMRSICVLMLRGLGLSSQLTERITDDALRDVIDAAVLPTQGRTS